MLLLLSKKLMCFSIFFFLVGALCGQAPEEPLHASIKLPKSHYFYPEMVVYHCAFGYSFDNSNFLENTRKIQCNRDGKFQPRTPSNCVGKAVICCMPTKGTLRRFNLWSKYFRQGCSLVCHILLMLSSHDLFHDKYGIV